MTYRKKKQSNKWPVGFFLVILVILVLLVTVLLRGSDVALLNPKGLIANEQRRLLIVSVVILLEIAIPTLTAFYYIAWKYRESNTKATYSPNARHSKFLVFNIWALPFGVMVLLASIMWPATHKLAPQKSIISSNKPIAIQVVALRWKWLFIYPEQQIATINFVQIPTDTPIQLDLTADEIPMSSFWIPHLAGQLYAMTGHVNRLNLMADTPGDFTGSTAEINGSGFAGMRFVTRASSSEDFNTWVQNVKSSSTFLDASEYQKLLAPSEYNKTAFYAKAGPAIYDTMLLKYTGSHDHHTEGK